MKKLMIIAILFSGIISAGYAQERPERKGKANFEKSPVERAEMSASKLEKELNLSKEQKEKVYSAQLERAEKMEKLQKTEHAFRKNQMEKRKEIMNETEKKVEKTLNAEQQKKLEEIKSNRKEHMKNRPEAERHGGKM